MGVSAIGASRHVVVIGAGLAGLTAAAHVRAAGHEVTVLEAGATPGGLIRTETIAGHPTVTLDMRMMPRCAGYVLLPEKSRLALTAHEFGHCLFGFVDLYDHDLYNNNMTVFPPDPEFKQCLALGPYSVMTKDCSGVRVDAWHKLLHPAEEVAGTGWVDEMVVIRDQLNMEVPMIENALRNPVILKLPDSVRGLLGETMTVNHALVKDGRTWRVDLPQTLKNLGSSFLGGELLGGAGGRDGGG